MDHRRVAVAVVLAALSGCVSGSPARHEAAPSRIAARPASARFDLDIVATDPARSVSLHSSGAFDRARQRLSFDTDLTPVDPKVGVVHVVVVDGVIYVDCPYVATLLGVPTRWISTQGSLDDVIGSLVVDPLELVRDTTMRFDAQPQGGHAVVAVRYFDVGANIMIAAPPADEVTDVTAALGG